MKYYQDTITGQIYAFTEYDNVEQIMQTNRNIPKTLIDKVKEKPSENHVWYNGDWIYKKDKPSNYEEPISEIFSYDPTWIIFLFEPLVIISDKKDDFIVTLDEINSNIYDTRKLSTFVTKLKNSDESCSFDILVTYDGSLTLPINENYNTPEKAINKFNEIIGALFLGGILVKPIDITGLYKGCIIEGGGSNFCYNPSINSDFRNKSQTITERIKVSHPNYIQIKEFTEAYNFGISIINKVNFSPIFLALGYHYLNQGKIAESLSNLWIVIEQLTDFLYQYKIDKNTLKLLKRVLPKSNIEIKHTILHETQVINEQTFQILIKNRKDRNKLLHEGIIPNRENVILLWDTLINLLEVVADIKVLKLQKISKQILTSNFENHVKNIVPKKTNFEQWIKDEKRLSYF
ncbi:hypothetical protein L5F24_11300 [Aliarcobacter butzleri]|uniref:hypothetical protein n=1 Tax=Aliarcobacter butzleri TaxID=28197 RepID=UPI001EDC628D|nr:hypothetical protein [Aliarcobacter butzleri]MCG3668582.1 hypothetical protein [Aliarcobacter butzleri]